VEADPAHFSASFFHSVAPPFAFPKKEP